jgi:putative peptide zinc metalloprotease protein
VSDMPGAARGATGIKAARAAVQQPALGPGSRLKMREIRVTGGPLEFLVGDMEHGEFIAVPPIAISVIGALQEGMTLAEAGALALGEAGAEVDVADFATTLLELGFVTEVDGVPVAADAPILRDGGPAGAAAARLARPFYSAQAWVIYCLLAIGCGVALVTVPRLRPHYWQTFFLPNPVLSLALLIVIISALGGGHEFAHWLGARIEAVPARITISRRYYLLVFQTDLSGLWSVPRRRRFGPIMAGIAFDVVTIAVLLMARAGQLEGWWHLPSALSNLIAAVIFWKLISFSMQFVVFLRTDIYAVLVVGLGCQNLSKVSRLRMTRWYRPLTEAEEQELGKASQRDLSVARWYCWFQLAGLALMIFYLFGYVVPITLTIIRWIATSVTGSSPATFAFWDALISGCVVLLPIALPTVMYLWEWQRERRRRSKPLAEPAGSGSLPPRTVNSVISWPRVTRRRGR